MFSPAQQAAMDDAWLMALRLLAQTEITWTQAKPPNATMTAMVAARHVGSDETEIVNAYGIDTLMIVAEASLFPERPTKFDRIDSVNGVHIVQGAMERVLSNRITFYQLFCRGRDS